MVWACRQAAGVRARAVRHRGLRAAGTAAARLHAQGKPWPSHLTARQHRLWHLHILLSRLLCLNFWRAICGQCFLSRLAISNLGDKFRKGRRMKELTTSGLHGAVVLKPHSLLLRLNSADVSCCELAWGEVCAGWGQGREIFVDAASNRPAPAPLPAGQPVEGCWFCLSNPNADVELVASVGALDSSPRCCRCPDTPCATTRLLSGMPAFCCWSLGHPGPQIKPVLQEESPALITRLELRECHGRTAIVSARPCRPAVAYAAMPRSTSRAAVRRGGVLCGDG